MNSFVIAVANEKGGVAKTTTTLSLGACLAAADQTVLLMDLDPQANLSLSLGCSSGENQASIYAFFQNGSSLGASIISTEFPNLFIAPSNPDLAKIERSKESVSDRKLSEGIQSCSAEFNFVLIDCPPRLGSLTRNAIASANLLVLPTQAEYFSVNGLRTMMNLIREIRSSSNPGLTYKLLLTMYEKRNKISRSLSDELRNAFGAGLFKTVIEKDPRLPESQALGQTIFELSPSSRSSTQYRHLAQEIETYAKAKRN